MLYFWSKWFTPYWLWHVVSVWVTFITYLTTRRFFCCCLWKPHKKKPYAVFRYLCCAFNLVHTECNKPTKWMQQRRHHKYSQSTNSHTRTHTQTHRLMCVFGSQPRSILSNAAAKPHDYRTGTNFNSRGMPRIAHIHYTTHTNTQYAVA